jgi:alpha-beta hydrolase superfamily lysophospholipase
MLQADPLWRRKQTASQLFQVFLMRLIVFLKARRITLPALVMQAEADKAVVVETNRKFYEVLASRDTTWKGYPNYSHDSEFERDRSQLDHDIMNWKLSIQLRPVMYALNLYVICCPIALPVEKRLKAR